MIKKNLFLLVLLMGTISSSFAREDLEGQYFGRVKYDDRSREVAVLFNPVQGEDGNYYAVVMEYLSYIREKHFISKFINPGKRGYLQELLEWIQIYKVKPDEKNPDQYNLYKIAIQEGEVTANSKEIGSIKMNRKFLGKNFFTLTTSINNKSLELNLRKRSRFPLKSTWELDYVPGPYNPGYKQGNTVILKLKNDYDKKTNEATAEFDVRELKGVPLKIQGLFTIKQIHKGMYIFIDNKPKGAIGADKVEGKIGVYIDVYNAQPVMNTYELILIDTQNAYNSQMYFESYGNKKSNK